VQLLLDIKSCSDRKDRTDKVYCFGKQNLEFTKFCGFDTVRLSARAYATPRLELLRNTRYGGMVVWGANHFAHKWMAIERAFDEYSSVLWLDWDLHQMVVLPEDLEDRLIDGDAPFRCGLATQRNWSWGAHWRHSEERALPGTQLVAGDTCQHAKTVCNCSAVWIRDLATVKSLQAIQRQYPLFMNQQIVSYFYDMLHDGKWSGVPTYMAEGFHLFGCDIGRTQYQPSEEVIWKCHPPERNSHRECPHQSVGSQPRVCCHGS
jgi:hypothetical protein